MAQPRRVPCNPARPEDDYEGDVTMKISQIMTRDVELCSSEDNLAAAASRMWDCDLGVLPVVDGDGQVIGMVTDRDICMAALTRGQALHEILVSVAMSKEVLSCAPDATLIEAEEIMRSGQVRRLPVIDSEASLVGIVSLNDLARLAEREIGRKNRDLSAQEVAATLAAVCEPRRGVSPDCHQGRDQAHARGEAKRSPIASAGPSD
jgi:CBS domain-containing protein